MNEFVDLLATTLFGLWKIVVNSTYKIVINLF